MILKRSMNLVDDFMSIIDARRHISRIVELYYDLFNATNMRSSYKIEIVICVPELSVSL